MGWVWRKVNFSPQFSAWWLPWGRWRLYIRFRPIWGFCVHYWFPKLPGHEQSSGSRGVYGVGFGGGVHFFPPFSAWWLPRCRRRLCVRPRLLWVFYGTIGPENTQSPGHPLGTGGVAGWWGAFFPAIFGVVVAAVSTEGLWYHLTKYNYYLPETWLIICHQKTPNLHTRFLFCPVPQKGFIFFPDFLHVVASSTGEGCM